MEPTTVLFQTWKNLDQVPDILDDAAHTWLHLNPSLRHRLFDDHFLTSWLTASDRYAWCHQESGPFIRTVDLFRYAYLYEEGGLYADMDFVCLAPIRELLHQQGSSALLGSMETTDEYKAHHIPNALMYSEKGHPFWLVVLALAMQRQGEATIEAATGPVLLGDAYLRYQSYGCTADILADPLIGVSAFHLGLTAGHPFRQVNLAAPDVFYPLSWTHAEQNDLKLSFRSVDRLSEEQWRDLHTTAQTKAFTFWYHSWIGCDDLAEQEGRSQEEMRKLGLI